MRNRYFDVLKGIAIIAVILYHIGICKYGYLGVDLFFVVSGYFTIKSIDKLFTTKSNNKFLPNRIYRLWPLQIIAGAICLVYGSFYMLPDDFENMTQSIVATNLFGNNVLQAITTKNYWDISNDYKPLMHTWYMGVIMQFYIIITIISFGIIKLVDKTNRRTKIFFCILQTIGLISLGLYLFEGNNAETFYFLPFRMFEFCAGMIAFYFSQHRQFKLNIKISNFLFITTYLGIFTLLFVDSLYIPRMIKLLSIVTFSTILIALMPSVSLAQKYCFSNKWIAIIGASSFSLFIWHQLVFAFTRYSFTNNFSNPLVLLIMILLIVGLSSLSYNYIEKIQTNKFIWRISIILFLFTTRSSLYIYMNAGVIRDVPELDVKKGNTHRGMWAEYCDRGYNYNKDFSDKEKTKWFVIGNSFGRDWVNIITESNIAERIELAYSDLENYKFETDRFVKANVIFLSTKGLNEELIKDVRNRTNLKTKFFIIGEKNFGECNGQIYRHRFDKNYHKMTVPMEYGYKERNEYFKKAYSDIYIDLIGIVTKKNDEVRVFSDDGKFISQDCRHLTQAGAQYYAQQLEWNRFFN